MGKQEKLTAEGNAGQKTFWQRWKSKIILITIVIVCIAVYMAVPSVHEAINNVIVTFKNGDFDQMKAFIAKYGKWAMLVSALLMIFQSIMAPLPAFFITLTNANLFGWWQGCILSFVSSMAGAALCFYIARILGRDVVEKICTKGALNQIEVFFEKQGKKCILIARLLPFISFDIVSYAAGLTAMDFGGFFLATGLGQLPACIVYSYVGGMLTGGAKKMFVGLLCLFALAILVVLLRQVYTANEKKKQAAAEKAGTVYVSDGMSAAVVLSKFYNSAFWGMAIAVLCTRSISLAMRVNVGWIFYGGWLILFLLSLMFSSLKCGTRFTVINAVFCSLVILVGSGSAIMVTPAATARMGIGMVDAPLGLFNTIIMAFVAVGFLLVIVLNSRRKKKAAAMIAAGPAASSGTSSAPSSDTAADAADQAAKEALPASETAPDEQLKEQPSEPSESASDDAPAEGETTSETAAAEGDSASK